MADVPLTDKNDLGLIADVRGLSKLKVLGNGSKAEQAQALKQAASQFEALLLKQCYDAMYNSNLSLNPDSPLHSRYSGFFEDMLNAQRVDAMVNQDGPISKNSITYLVAKQFAKSLGDEGKKMLESLTAGNRDLNPTSEITLSGSYKPNNFATLQMSNARAAINSYKQQYGDLPQIDGEFADPQDFVDKLMPYAVKATQGQNMNPLVLVAQAALETGWGEHVPAGNNYYGIKAGGSWQGAAEDFATHEYENGSRVNKKDRFRAYGSLLESMHDYVNLIKTNERYAKASALSFDTDKYFDEIQKAGYATDPNYAKKLKKIAQKVAFMAYK